MQEILRNVTKERKDKFVSKRLPDRDGEALALGTGFNMDKTCNGCLSWGS